MNRRNFIKRIGYAIAGGLSLPFLVKGKPEPVLGWRATWKIGLNKEYEHKIAIPGEVVYIPLGFKPDVFIVKQTVSI